MASKTMITVSACSGCPFFERHAMSMAADFLLKRVTKSGSCRFHGLDAIFPMGRVHVEDSNLTPKNCPLRTTEATITLDPKA